MINKDNLVPGQKIYRVRSPKVNYGYDSKVTPKLEMLIHEGDGKFVSGNKLKYAWNDDLAHYSLSFDLAKIEFYKEELKKASDAKSKLNSKIKNIDKLVSDFDFSFGDLKSDYPEEFI